MKRRGFFGVLFGGTVAAATIGWNKAVVPVAKRIVTDRLLGVAGEDLHAGDAVTLDKSGLVFRLKGSRYSKEEREKHGAGLV
jgi:hypothetical protein